MPETSDSFNFGEAIGWNGRNMWLALQVSDQHSKMSLPYIYMFTADKHLVPWLASQTDMLAEDWIWGVNRVTKPEESARRDGRGSCLWGGALGPSPRGGSDL